MIDVVIDVPLFKQVIAKIMKDLEKLESDGVKTLTSDQISKLVERRMHQAIDAEVPTYHGPGGNYKSEPGKKSFKDKVQELIDRNANS